MGGFFDSDGDYIPTGSSNDKSGCGVIIIALLALYLLRGCS